MLLSTDRCILTDYYTLYKCFSVPVNSRHFSPGILPWQRFVLITEGEGTFFPDNGETIPVRKNDILYIESDTSYYTEWKAGSGFCSVGFRLAEDRPFFEDTGGILRFSQDGSLNRGFQEADDAYRLREPGAPLLCGAKILSLLYQLAQLDSRTRRRDRLDKSILYLEQHCEERPDASQLAALCGVSVPVFYRRFKERTGMTVTDYRYTVLFRHARTLLDTGEKNVGETAEALGFNDVFYFSKLFTRYCGLSPERYRKGERTGFSQPEG